MPVRRGFKAWAQKARLASQLGFLLLLVVLVSGAICVFGGRNLAALEPFGLFQILALPFRAEWPAARSRPNA